MRNSGSVEEVKQQLSFVLFNLAHAVHHHIDSDCRTTNSPTSSSSSCCRNAATAVHRNGVWQSRFAHIGAVCASAHSTRRQSDGAQRRATARRSRYERELVPRDRKLAAVRVRRAIGLTYALSHTTDSARIAIGQWSHVESNSELRPCHKVGPDGKPTHFPLVIGACEWSNAHLEFAKGTNVLCFFSFFFFAFFLLFSRHVIVENCVAVVQN